MNRKIYIYIYIYISDNISDKYIEYISEYKKNAHNDGNRNLPLNGF